MTEADHKADLHHYLQMAREALMWKLDALSEYDVRRPLTPTGTNLLGLVKHVAIVELGYFGDTFGRPSPEPQPWLAPDAEPNADIVRELIDGAAGLRADNDNLPTSGEAWWATYRSQLERVADEFTTA